MPGVRFSHVGLYGPAGAGLAMRLFAPENREVSYEYRVEAFTNDPQRLTQLLNQFGAEGWQLVFATPTVMESALAVPGKNQQVVVPRAPGLYCVFMRPKAKAESDALDESSWPARAS